MTSLAAPAPPSPTVPRGRFRGLAFGALALVVAGFAFAAGAGWSDRRAELGGWHEGSAYVGADQFEVDEGGWSYGASLAVSSWIDADGSWHDQGRPDCLRVPAGTRVPIRFQAREVTVEGITTRPVVVVDCRATGSSPG